MVSWSGHRPGLGRARRRVPPVPRPNGMERLHGAGIGGCRGGGGRGGWRGSWRRSGLHFDGACRNRKLLVKGYSSVGRATVSKTVGRGFKSCCPCQPFSAVSSRFQPFPEQPACREPDRQPSARRSRGDARGGTGRGGIVAHSREEATRFSSALRQREGLGRPSCVNGSCLERFCRAASSRFPKSIAFEANSRGRRGVP